MSSRRKEKEDGKKTRLTLDGSAEELLGDLSDTLGDVVGLSGGLDEPHLVGEREAMSSRRRRRTRGVKDEQRPEQPAKRPQQRRLGEPPREQRRWLQ